MLLASSGERCQTQRGVFLRCGCWRPRQRGLYLPKCAGRDGLFYAPIAVQVTLCFTGKFNELAMKHILFASSCREFAHEMSSGLEITTSGRSKISVNFPLPSGFSVMVPFALSLYSITTIPFFEHRCKYHSIWQEETDDSIKSSGLYMDLSPKKIESDEPCIGFLPSISTTKSLSYER